MLVHCAFSYCLTRRAAFLIASRCSGSFRSGQSVSVDAELLEFLADLFVDIELAFVCHDQYNEDQSKE
jgi:hypothetical protein